MKELRVVTAFPAEASLFIKHFRLRKKVQRYGFQIYVANNHALVLSGPGWSAAAAAVTHLHDECGGKTGCVWINMGVAGHADLSLGEVVLASRISASHSEQVWTTRQNLAHCLPTCSLISVDSPVSEYAPETLYDMEAFGFYTAATEYTRKKLIQCIKVVSDNRRFPVNTFSKKKAKILLQQSEDKIVSFINDLLQH